MNRFNTRVRRILGATGMILLVTLLASPTVLAFEGRGGDVVVIEAGEVIDDAST